jgi:predicted ArsR family transcriptional regulator
VLDLPMLPSQDDVLCQPTRARLFALLTELRRPAATAELAQRLGLHPNGVRIHLDRLQSAGLLARTRTRRPRGRPPDAWTIASGARPGGRAPSAYRDLGRWLARSLQARSGGVRGIEQSGRQIGREIAPVGSSGPDAMQRSLAALGFQPAVRLRERDRLTLRLGNCPYRDAVRENQQAVCALHKGITRGLLDVLSPQARLAGFVPRDAEKAGCLVELRGIRGSRARG